MIVFRCAWANIGAKRAWLVTAIAAVWLIRNGFPVDPLGILFVIGAPSYAIGATIQSVRYYLKTFRYLSLFGPDFAHEVTAESKKGDWWDCPIVGMRLALRDYELEQSIQ